MMPCNLCSPADENGSYKILRRIGLIGLLGEQSPVRHPAKRQRIKTVIQELMSVIPKSWQAGFW